MTNTIPDSGRPTLLAVSHPARHSGECHDCVGRSFSSPGEAIRHAQDTAHVTEWNVTHTTTWRLVDEAPSDVEGFSITGRAS